MDPRIKFIIFAAEPSLLTFSNKCFRKFCFYFYFFKYGMIHKCTHHPYTGAMLISISFHFFLVYMLLKFWSFILMKLYYSSLSEIYYRRCTKILILLMVTLKLRKNNSLLWNWNFSSLIPGTVIAIVKVVWGVAPAWP